jgi:hypothetical protein
MIEAENIGPDVGTRHRATVSGASGGVGLPTLPA